MLALWANPEPSNAVRRQLLDILAAGMTLVVDRYAYSGAAFTAAKGVPALDLPWCKVGACPPCSLPAAFLASTWFPVTRHCLGSHMGDGCRNQCCDDDQLVLLLLDMRLANGSI